MSSYFGVRHDITDRAQRFFEPRKLFEFLVREKSFNFIIIDFHPPQIILSSILNVNPENEVIFVESKFPFCRKFSVTCANMTIFGRKIFYNSGMKIIIEPKDGLLKSKSITFVFSHGLVCICKVSIRSGISDEEMKNYGYPTVSQIPCLTDQVEKYDSALNLNALISSA